MKTKARTKRRKKKLYSEKVNKIKKGKKLGRRRSGWGRGGKEASKHEKEDDAVKEYKEVLEDDNNSDLDMFTRSTESLGIKYREQE